MLTEKQFQIASKRAGVPVALLKLVVGQESGGRHGARSPVGASGEMQLMPETARGLERKYHINTRTPMGNLLGGAYYLSEQIKHFGSIRLGLAAYNAGPGAVENYHGIPPYHETQDYVSSIMERYRKWAKAAPATRASTSIPSPSLPSLNPGKVDTRSLALGGLQHISEGDYDPVKQLEALHEAMLSASQAGQSGAPILPATTGPGQTTAATGDISGNWHKWVKLAKGADRPGVHTSGEVLQFVGALGMRVKRRLVIGTGTQHNEFVVGTHRESAHWTGHAADIPASGRYLTFLGRKALIQAGMSPKEAMKVKGGLFNIGGYQIIFNTNEGGNHFNHLHIGIR